MISKKIEKALNNQLVLEATASFTYLSMASWCEKEGFEGAAKFFYQHAEEENMHLMKIFTYINEVGGHALVPAVNQPILEFNSVLEMCEIAFEKEKKVTQSIHDIVALSLKEKDYTTDSFLQYFVDEQREEEVLFDRVISKIKLIGNGGQSLYYVDKELEKLTTAHASKDSTNE